MPHADTPRFHGPMSRRGSAALLAFFFIVLIALGFLLWRWQDKTKTASLPRVEASSRPITARGDLADNEKSTVELFQRSSPSVVYISTLAKVRNPFTLNITEVPQGTGSGFIWDDLGHVVTNFHVIQQASAATVTLAGHDSYPARLVGAAPNYDLAVLRIEAPKERLRAILVGSSADLKVGQSVFAIGNPFGLDQTLTTGVVSALNRTIQGVSGRPIEGVIQTDAAINPGNSGGPLLDSAGRLIGINTMIVSPSGAYAGIGFAVPVDTINRIVPQLISKGKVARLALGLQLSDALSRQMAARYGVQGIAVIGVEPGTPAAQAGIEPAQRAPDGSIALGDVIQAVNGRNVANEAQLYSALQRQVEGDKVSLRVWRANKVRTVELPLLSVID